MARRTQAANGTTTNGAHQSEHTPPASTLAAQIVQNRARQDASQKPSQTISFEQLLQEILHNDVAPPETDVQVNVQLINVVLEAGLGPLTNKDPFAQRDILIRQAADSIAVIKATILRQPEVLLTSATLDAPPLFVSLFARLLATVRNEESETLAWTDILGYAVNAINRSTDLWQYAEVLSTVYRECVDGMYLYQVRGVSLCSSLILQIAWPLSTER